MVFTLSRSKHGKKCSYKSKKWRCTTVDSYINSSETNNKNTYKIDSCIGNSNLLHINIQTKISFNKLINLQTKTDTQSIMSINDETIDENSISEEISSHKN